MLWSPQKGNGNACREVRYLVNTQYNMLYR